jgi:hypothetical protein
MLGKKEIKKEINEVCPCCKRMATLKLIDFDKVGGQFAWGYECDTCIEHNNRRLVT